MRRRRILYLMHVDWRWMKQRPHFLAEALAGEGWDVQLGYVPTWRRAKLPRNITCLRRQPLPLVPRWTDPRALAWNSSVGKSFMKRLIGKAKPDLIWISHAGLATAIGELDIPIVYDVMDLNTEFHASEQASSAALKQEIAAWSMAARLFCSSNAIRDEVTRLAPHVSRITRYVPNAYDDARRWTEYRRHPDSTYRLTYIGTISDWFDIGLLEHALENVAGLEVLLVGPVSCSLPKISGLRVAGVMAHDQIHKLAAETDCFILPFIPTSLVRGVDPVKAYEYLAMSRPVLSCHYPELERFRGLFNFYASRDDFVELIHCRPSVPPADRVTAFLAENTWRRRGEDASAQLHELLT